MKYRSTKTYGPEIGLSACFRQWRAKSHCRLLHGYALSVKLEFESYILDGNNWVLDFGAMKPFKQQLESLFDHKLLVAEDDPEKDALCMLGGQGLADVVILPAVGCEAFAAVVFEHARAWLEREGHSPRVRIAAVEVREHGANSAIYVG